MPRNGPSSPTVPVTSQRRTRFAIVALSLTFILLNGFQAYTDAMTERDEIVADARVNAETLLVSLDEHLTRTIHAAAPILSLAGAQVEAALVNGTFDPLSLFPAFGRIGSGVPQLGSVTFLDAEGRVRISSNDSSPAPVDLSSRDYFQRHKFDGSPDLQIGAPVTGRLTGLTMVPLSRRVNDPNGHFAGVVIGTLDAAYFEKFYSRLQTRSSTLAVLSESGTLLARIPAEPARIGTSLADLPAFARLKQNSQGWFATDADEFGPARYVAYRRVEGLPFALIITVPTAVLLEPWTQSVKDRVVATFWISLAVLLFAGLLLRANYRQERLARGLADSEARYRDLVDASSDWHWEMGPDLRFTAVRDRRNHGSVPYEEVIGRSRAEIVDIPGTPLLQQHLDDLAHHRPFRDFVYRRVLESGQVRYTKSSGKPVFGSDGTFRGYRGTATDVTDMKLAEERVSAARRLLSSAIETLHEGFVLFDAEDRFVQCNSKYRELYADTADLLVPGAHYETILRESAARGQFPEAEGRARKWMQSAMAYHYIKASTRQRRLPGNRWVEVREVKLEDGGSVGIHIDITESKLAQEKLRESEERLRIIAANMPGVVLERALGADNALRHLYVSERAKEVTGYSAQELIEDPQIMVRLLGEPFYAEYCARIREGARLMEPIELEYVFTRRDGAQRWARSSMRPRCSPNGEVLWDSLLLDITEQKAAETERRELENQLRHLQRVEAVGTLAGGMAHEINNKLVPIVTFSELLLMQETADSPKRKPLKTIHEAAGKIRDLVSRILTMSRNETVGTAVIELKPVIGDALALLRATLRPNVRLALDAETSGHVLGDASQIGQVLVNLSTNAAHAIGTDQGEIRIALDEIDLVDGLSAGAGGLPRGRYVRLRVSDTGCGMDSRTLQRIFEPFYTTKGLGEGTGLGLSIVHGIVTAHRGRISVESEPGRGTTFTILLPLAAANDSFRSITSEASSI
jgi:PAS domain S-box-containing protein